MKSTLIIENEDANSYYPGYEISSFFLMEEGDDSHLNLEFTREGEDDEWHIFLECNERSLDAVYNRVCDSMINHPHIIDLRGLKVRVNAQQR